VTGRPDLASHRNGSTLLVVHKEISISFGSIGITTAIFSVLYAMLIRPLPYNNPEAIVGDAGGLTVGGIRNQLPIRSI
jgi:hypothetical protein